MKISRWFAWMLGRKGFRAGTKGMGGGQQPSPPEQLAESAAERLEGNDSADLELARSIPAPQIDRWFYPRLFNLDSWEERPLNPAESSLLEAFRQIAAGPKLSSRLIPRLPLVIPQLMRSLKDERTSGAQLARQVAKDPVLLGEVIRVANSPYYRRAHKIASLEQAIVLLGRDGLQQLIARVAFYPIFNLRGGQLIRQAAARVWGHSERCAMVCHCLAKRFGEDLFAAYLAGLVANLGLIVGLRLMDQRLDLEHDPLPRAESFYGEFIQLARQLSLRIIEDWNFPQGVIAALSEQLACAEAESSSMLGCCLALGDRYSKLNLLLEQGYLSAEELDPEALVANPCYRRLIVEFTA